MFGLRLTIVLTSRMMKFHAASSAVLTNRIKEFEHVYVHVILAKCLPILFHANYVFAISLRYTI